MTIRHANATEGFRVMARWARVRCRYTVVTTKAIWEISSPMRTASRTASTLTRLAQVVNRECARADLLPAPARRAWMQIAAVTGQLSSPTETDGRSSWDQTECSAIDANDAGNRDRPVRAQGAAPTAVLIRPDAYIAWVRDGTKT